MSSGVQGSAALCCVRNHVFGGDRLRNRRMFFFKNGKSGLINLQNKLIVNLEYNQ